MDETINKQEKIESLIQDVPFDPDYQNGMFSMAVYWMASAGDLIPPYWSFARDQWLRNFWKQVDPLNIVVTTFVNKSVTMPFTITPRDRSIKSHITQAEQLESDIRRQSGFFRGFRVEFAKAVTDYLTTDNGGFMIVMGGGSADGPIEGQPTGVLHLDSNRCIRTSDPKYPVVYNDIDGRFYRLHYTRIIAFSHLPSSQANLNSVGFCPVSNCIRSAQQQRNLYIHSEEKLGSRPQRQILYVKKGATIDQLSSAIKVGQQKMDSEGLESFSKTLVLAPKSANHELDLGTLTLNSLPDGFNRMEVTMSDMAIISASFGLDLQDINFSFGSVAASAASDVQERKGRGKGIGSLLELLSDEFSLKICPPHLRWEFDQNDDEQDEQQSMIWNTRSQARERDLRSGATTVRAERERMLELKEISQSLFNTMELGDGRLPDGTDVILLFYTSDPYISNLLAMPFDQPDNISANDPITMLDAIQMQISETWRAIETARTSSLLFKARCAMSALEKLRMLYQGALDEQILAQQAAISALSTDETADDSLLPDVLPTTNNSTLNDSPAVESIDQGSAQAQTNGVVA